MERSVIIFGSILKSNFWQVFDIFLDLVILAYLRMQCTQIYFLSCNAYIYSKYSNNYINLYIIGNNNEQTMQKFDDCCYVSDPREVTRRKPQFRTTFILEKIAMYTSNLEVFCLYRWYYEIVTSKTVSAILAKECNTQSAADWMCKM